MRRARRIAVVAHCLLNANARARGLAHWDTAHPVAVALADRGIGLVQLPCPEVLHQGVDRDPAPIEAYDTADFRRLCTSLAEETLRLVEGYVQDGYEVEMVVGVEGSPSCGVTAVGSAAAMAGDSGRSPGMGIFANELAERLRPLGVRFTAIDTRAPDDGVVRVLEALDAR